MQITKYILPVVAGTMAAMMLILVGETAIIKMYLPLNISPNDTEAVSNAVKYMPLSALLFLLVNYVICSLIAGVVSTLIAKRITKRPAVVVGIVLTLGGLYNVISIPHPMWFTVLNLFIYLPFTYLGYLVTRKKEPLFSNNDSE